MLTLLFIIVVTCPDEGALNDPEALGLVFHQGPTVIMHVVKLLQTWLVKISDKMMFLLVFICGHEPPCRMGV